MERACCRKGNGFYEELDVEALLEEEEEEELDEELQGDDEELPEGVFEVERVVQRRVRKVS